MSSVIRAASLALMLSGCASAEWKAYCAKYDCLTPEEIRYYERDGLLIIQRRW